MAAVVVRPSTGGRTAVTRLLAEWPELRAALLGAVGLGTVGGLLNDSGIAVPTIVAEVGAGLVVACLPSSRVTGEEVVTPGPSPRAADPVDPGPDAGRERAHAPATAPAPGPASAPGSAPDGWEPV